MKVLSAPISKKDIDELEVGDLIEVSGYIFAGRDSVLPKLVGLGDESRLNELNLSFEGSVIFHSAVSIAGIGPTSSNKLEIESSMVPLSRMGVRLHIGKGAIGEDTVRGLANNHAVFAIIPPVSALLTSLAVEKELVAFPEEGMEALFRLKVRGFTAIVAAAKGKSIFTD
jgi:fumarate hydratase subunit beta